MKEFREIDSSAFFFFVFHCLISILSPAVRKTNYVFNPLPHPHPSTPPLLFRSSHLEIIMSLWQTTLALEKGRRGGKKLRVHLPSFKQTAGNYGQPFDPPKLSPRILSGPDQVQSCAPASFLSCTSASLNQRCTPNLFVIKAEGGHLDGCF